MVPPAQVLLPEGPTTYSIGDLRAAAQLAHKIVASYGMAIPEVGIPMYAPKHRPPGFMKRAFEVRRNLCALLFNPHLKKKENEC